jgi:phosphoglycerol transferase MdoB-like AlkP superfamily enzyme
LLNNSDMAFGALAAIILDYAAVAFVIGLLVLDRWLGVRRGITLDTLFGLIVALGMAAWFAGTRFKRRLLRHPAGTEPTPKACAGCKRAGAIALGSSFVQGQ